MDKLLNKHENNFLGSGWAFPVSFTVGNYRLNTSSYEQNINESINLILLTREGERSLESEFGSSLYKFQFRKMDETLKGEIINAVKMALLHNEPRITVLNVLVDYPDINSGVIYINIVYEFNQTNTRHNYVFPFHVLEGTNLQRL